MTQYRSPNLEVSAESLAIIKTAQRALNELDKQTHKSWTYWKQVGAGFVEIRTLAMREGGANRPYGRAYTAAFARLLAHYKFADRIKDPGDRQKLVAVMDNLAAIERWMETLPPEDRRRWTHPTTIYRHWQKSLLPPRAYEGKAPAEKQVIQETLTEAVDSLRKENTGLKIEANKRCEVDLMQSSIEDIENWLRMRILSEHKARRLRDVLNELYPRPLPAVPVTHPDSSANDDIGL
jgi:hypothetical protein